MEFMGYGNFPYRPICTLKNIPVEHCPNSYGVLLALAQMNIKYPTFTLCYSGDTRPSENLVNVCIEYGNYAPKTESRVRVETKSNDEYKISLLIHEASFDDDDIGQQEAIKKRHSTIREALDISNQIKAKSLILTHFSQRYPKLPPSYISKEQLGSKPINGAELKKSIVSAYDGMILPLRPDLQRVLPLIESVLLQLFGSDDEKK
jgi:ribonuclease BN (tRNA processing enzyme)